MSDSLTYHCNRQQERRVEMKWMEQGLCKKTLTKISNTLSQHKPASRRGASRENRVGRKKVAEFTFTTYNKNL